MTRHAVISWAEAGGAACSSGCSGTERAGLAAVCGRRKGGVDQPSYLTAAGRGSHGSVRDWLEAEFGVAYTTGRRTSKPKRPGKRGLRACLKAVGLKAGQSIV